MKTIFDFLGRWLFTYMVKSGLILQCSSAPDNSGQNAAALQQAALSKEQLDWAKKIYADTAPDRTDAIQRANAVSDQQLASGKANDALASDYANYNKTTFRPLEQGIVSDAQSYDTPEKRQAAANAAMADTNMAFGAANKATAQQLAANGIDPGSTRAMAVMEGQGVNQATANAGAAYKARQGVETMGAARKMDAASLGRNLPSAQATSAGIALNAGNSSAANGAMSSSINAQGAQIVNQGYSGAQQGLAGASDTYGSIAKQQTSANNANNGLWQAAGTVAGMFMMSDKNMKKDIAPVSDAEALAATNATPVKKWKYDPAKLSANGVSMPADAMGENIGPMAQDMNKTMGEEAAPDGKKINLVTANGINMKSIQAVDKKVVKLTKEVSSLAAMIRGGKVQAGAQA